MTPKLFLHIALIFLIAGLLLSACTPLAEPVENTAAPNATPLVPASPTAQRLPPTETSPADNAGSEASGCPPSSETVYVNSLYGYCFAYPKSFKVQIDNPLALAIVGQALDESSDPLRVSLVVSARPIAETADLGGLVSGFLSQNIISQLPTPVQRTQAFLGGEPAEVLEGVPARLSMRVVMAVHGPLVYQLYFHPSGEEAAAVDLEELYQKVLDTFAFFPAEGQPAVQPEPAVFFDSGRFFKFAYDPALALLIEPETVPAVQLIPEVMFADAHPAFVQFRFLGYNGGLLAQLPYPFQTPRLMAFQPQDFSRIRTRSTHGIP